MAKHELRYDGWTLDLTDEDADTLTQAIRDAKEGPYVLDQELSGGRRVVLPLGGGVPVAVVSLPTVPSRSFGRIR